MSCRLLQAGCGSGAAGQAGERALLVFSASLRAGGALAPWLLPFSGSGVKAVVNRFKQEQARKAKGSAFRLARLVRWAECGPRVWQGASNEAEAAVIRVVSPGPAWRAVSSRDKPCLNLIHE